MNIKLHPAVAYMIDHGALDARRMAQLQRAEHLVSGDWVGQIVARPADEKLQAAIQDEVIAFTERFPVP